MRLGQRIRYAKPLAMPLLKYNLKKLGFVHQVYRGADIGSHYRSHDERIDRRVRDGEFSHMHIFALPVAEAFRRQFPTRPANGFEDAVHEQMYRQKLAGWAYEFEQLKQDARNHVGKLIFSWGGEPHEYLNYMASEGIELPHPVGIMNRLPDRYHVVVLVGKNPKALERERKQKEKERQSVRVQQTPRR